MSKSALAAAVGFVGGVLATLAYIRWLLSMGGQAKP